jgi:hypothetical protein
MTTQREAAYLAVPEPTGEQILEQLRRDHVQDWSRKGYSACNWCGYTWPCITFRLIAALDEAVRQLVEDAARGWKGFTPTIYAKLQPPAEAAEAEKERG